MKKHKKLKIFLIGLVSLVVLICLGGFLWLKTSSYQASDSAQSAAQKATASDDYYLFSSGKEQNKNAILFCPGALVDSASYSLWAEQVADAGYDVYLLKAPFDLAMLAGSKPERILEEHPDQKFIVGGHSLGGVMACRFAADNSSQISGVLFLGSYPDEKGALNQSKLPVLSLTASNDKVLDWDNYEDAKKYLPEDTDYVEISGGNHAGFGSYGAQKGDGKASISNTEQQQAIAEHIIQWLEKISDK